jgi:hypothetical protein
MKFIWSFLICLVFTVPLSAQDKGSQIEAVKVAFITQKIDLSSSQAEKFWPIYQDYQREIREVFKQRKEARNQKNGNDKVDGELDFEGRLLEVRKKYKQEFSKVIPPEKVLQFYSAEREFRETMIKELKERRHKQ